MDHFAGLNVSVKEKSILTVRGSSLASRKQNPRQVDNGDKRQRVAFIQGVLKCRCQLSPKVG